jgi:hypothetical protein
LSSSGTFGLDGLGFPVGDLILSNEHGHLRIQTSRTGIGARAGHDLTIEASRWRAMMHSEGGPPRLLVEVDPRSLKVLEGRGGARPLDERQLGEIETNLQRLVLESDRYPRIAFQATEWQVLAEDGDTIRAAVTGDLHLHGKRGPVTAEVELRRENDVAQVTASATVIQSQWGIKPYTAFLGALKVADSVRIHAQATLPGT